MFFEARPRSFVLVLVGALAASAACVSEFDRDALSGRACPCLPGWVCDESQGAGVCVEQTLGAGGSSGASAGSGGTFVTHSGPDAGGAAGEEGGADGGAGLAPQDAGAGQGGSAGTGECATAAPPTAADCPAVCDDCSNGTCHIRCDGARDCSAQSIDCPAGLQCEVSCASPDNCGETEVRCSGSQACDVLCTGQRSCIGVSLGCADGPCELHCGAQAQVCRDSVVVCGGGACRSSCAGLLKPSVIGCAGSCSPACGC